MSNERRVGLLKPINLVIFFIRGQEQGLKQILLEELPEKRWRVDLVEGLLNLIPVVSRIVVGNDWLRRQLQTQVSEQEEHDHDKESTALGGLPVTRDPHLLLVSLERPLQPREVCEELFFGISHLRQRHRVVNQCFTAFILVLHLLFYRLHELAVLSIKAEFLKLGIFALHVFFATQIKRCKQFAATFTIGSFVDAAAVLILLLA